MRVSYHGWSSVTVQLNDTVVGFDAMSPECLRVGGGVEPVLCVTHGHPDHCGALLDAADRDERLDGVAVVSSVEVVDHFARRGAIEEGLEFTFGGHHSLDVRGVRISSFFWTHLPLLPPETANKLDHLVGLISHPIRAGRIALSGLRLPFSSPNVGFCLTPADGPTVLNYAEGLHRETDPGEVDEVAARFGEIDILLCAVEPEDRDEVPRWIDRLDPTRAFLYEAHRPWRECFGLGTFELAEYAEAVDGALADIRVEALDEPGIERTC